MIRVLFFYYVYYEVAILFLQIDEFCDLIGQLLWVWLAHPVPINIAESALHDDESSRDTVSMLRRCPEMEREVR